VKSFKVLIFLFILSSSVFAQSVGAQAVAGEQVTADENGNLDVALEDPDLSLRYQRGSYLLYDCIEKHWVCTGSPEYNYCKKSREEAILDRSPKLPCAHVKLFKNEKSCNRTQQIITSRGDYARFCLHPEYKKKESVY
jgi:hypothetical protein